MRNLQLLTSCSVKRWSYKASPTGIGTCMCTDAADAQATPTSQAATQAVRPSMPVCPTVRSSWNLACIHERAESVTTYTTCTLSCRAYVPVELRIDGATSHKATSSHALPDL